MLPGQLAYRWAVEIGEWVVVGDAETGDDGGQWLLVDDRRTGSGGCRLVGGNRQAGSEIEAKVLGREHWFAGGSVGVILRARR
jgi:hypothetical protein